MKSNYEEKKEAQLEAYKNLAAKNEQLSESTWKQSKALSDLMNGQPILIGHHSEKRHRKDIERMHNAISKSVEADKKSEYYKQRIESLLNGTAVSSDDPNAIDKLTEKLERLEALQELYKQINKVVKKAKLSDAEKVTELMELGLSENRAMNMLEKDFAGRVGIQSFRLTNNNATIRNTKQRIEHLTKIASIESTEEEINGITLKINAEDNRVQIFFPGIPDESVRKELKSNGFHWAPSVGGWMRQISNHAIYVAKQIISKI